MLVLVFTGCGPDASDSGAVSSSAQVDSTLSAQPVTFTIREINKHGNIILDTNPGQMQAAGFEAGDIITVSFGGKEFSMPIGTSYTDVDSGEMICRFDLEDNKVALAVNYGSFASDAGVAVKETIEDEPGYRWSYDTPSVEVRLSAKGGYIDEYNARNLTFSEKREDYPGLSDEQFANFRAVSAKGIKEGVIYRSSTPIDPSLGRDKYAMAAMREAGIKAVINLENSAEAMRDFSAFPGSYYSTCAVINPEITYDAAGPELSGKIKECVLFMLDNDGPYLIHCKEGKGRTGLFCALLECFAGCDAQDVTRDYMITFENYYGIRQGEAVYGIVLRNTLQQVLCELLGIDNMETADLRQAAEQYLLSAGLTVEQLSALSEKIVSD